MNIDIRSARSEDVRDVIRLMREFAEYERLLDSFEITDEKLTDALFGNRPVAEMLVAATSGMIVGYALFLPCFASFRGQRGLYLEDIYISAYYRGRGIGRSLLGAVAAAAAKRGCERIDFQVLEWNHAAIAFYEKLGAVRNDDERHFKFSDAAFRDLSSEK
jgi:ribosomal protein S18 acetylase RimI-like enzyme